MLEKLNAVQTKIKDLQQVINLLSWDLKVNLPEGAKEDTILLLSKLEDKLFILKTSDSYGKIMKSIIEGPIFDKLCIEDQKNLKMVYKNYLRDLCIPREFYVKYVTFKEKSVSVWEEAKEKNDYKLFEPYLKEIIKLTKEYYSYFTDTNIYDAMLSDYEDNLSQEVIDPLFDKLKKELIPLIKKSSEKKSIVKMDFDYTKVMECSKYLLNYIGFDMNRGTLGIYPHGFTEKISDNDIRIAFSKTNNSTDFLSTIIHEGGHGIFEQNMGDFSIYNYLGNNAYFALHESQSRFYENMLGRNKNFWIPIYDDIKTILDLNCDIDTFVRILNTSEASLIRTEADELTYCMHIIIRYEIEKDLFSGKIDTDELPSVWNKKMEEYLGVKVINDKDGILQDMHWSDGSFGYFPAYLMGSIYDGIFLDIIEKNLGNVDEILRNGDIKKITNYLIENVYKHGGSFTGMEVLKNLGIDEISVDYLINYLKKKYGKEQ